MRWKGWGPGDDTWEPEDNLDCPEIIEKFMDKWEETEAIRENRLPSKSLNVYDFGMKMYTSQHKYRKGV